MPRRSPTPWSRGLRVSPVPESWAPRVDQLVLGRGTARRFTLLAALLLASCVNQIWMTTLAICSKSSFTRCANAAGVDLSAPRSDQLPQLTTDSFNACRLEAVSDALHIALVGTGAVVCTALALYWTAPSWRRRRRRMVPAATFGSEARRDPVPPTPFMYQRVWTAEEWVRRERGETSAPEVTRQEPLSHHLSRLTHKAGVGREPSFVVDVGALTAGAVVFGRGGRHTVCLYAGLLARRATHPELFDAVVLHELAHVRNSDVDIAYVTLALWRVFLFAVLLPCGVITSWQILEQSVLGRHPIYWGDATPNWSTLGLCVLLVTVVYLLRADILRRREFVADLDALAHGADPGMWRAVNTALAEKSGDQSARSRWVSAGRWFVNQWRTHPTWEQRHEILVRPETIDAGGTALQFLLLSGVIVAVSPKAALLNEPSWLYRAFVIACFLPAAATFLMVLPKTPERIPRHGSWQPPLRGSRLVHRYITMPISWRLGMLLACICLFVVADAIGWSGHAKLSPVVKVTDRVDKLPAEYRGLPHDRVTSEVACPVGQVGRMSPCPSPIRKSSARTSCGSRGTVARV